MGAIEVTDVVFERWGGGINVSDNATFEKWGSEVSVPEDVIRSAGSAPAKSIIGIAGSGGDVRDLGVSAVQWIGRKLGLGELPPEAVEYIRERGTLSSLPTSSEIRSGVEGITGKLYEPKTREGKYTGAAVQGLTGAALSPATSVRQFGGNLIKYGVIPGLTSEAAGHASEGSWFEPYARALGAVGGAGASALLSRPAGANSALSNAMGGIDRANMQAAWQLMDDAAQRGLNLTWGQALDQVTSGGAKSLLNLERVVEGSQRGRSTMADFYAGQPAAARQAVLAEADNIAPQSMAPSTIGPRASGAARQAIDDVEGAINSSTRPLYQAAERQTIPAAQYQQLAADPRYTAALRYIRQHPELGPQYAQLPDNAVGVVDAVKKLLRTRSEVTPDADATERYLGGLRSTAAENAGNAATRTSPQYAQAVAEQNRLRSDILDPLQQGPLGKVAAANTTEGAVNALLPNKPLAGTPNEVRVAVRAMSAYDEPTARAIVRQHIESTLNTAGRDLVSGPNQMGGARVRAALYGNEQSATNLRAAIESLPGSGPQVVQGFDRLMQILEAQGRRQQIGSQTDFNRIINEHLRAGGAIGEVMSTAAAPGSWVTKVRDLYEGWRYGRNTADLANILTDPNSMRLLSDLALHAPGSRRGMDLAARIVVGAITTQGPNSQALPPPRGSE
jgi:hypothetical protein